MIDKKIYSTGGNLGGPLDTHKLPPIPDWRKYKVEDCPELLYVQKALAQKGLKDPWLRNHAWRYDRKEFPTPTENVKIFLFRGWKLGFALAVGTVILEKVYHHYFPQKVWVGPGQWALPDPADSHGHH